MRRAWWLVLACASRAAHGSPWSLTLEAGAEADTNVQRVETDPSQSVVPISALALRTGARIEHGDRVLGGTLALAGTASARVITNDRVETSPEDIGLLAADARYVHPIGERPVGVGVAVQAADAVALDADVGDRTFRNLGADALLVLRGSDTRRLTLALGGRQFDYKPAPEFSYRAPAASLRLDLVLWAADDGVRSLELASTLAFEAREFNSAALVDICPPGMNAASCTGTSSFLRRDGYNRADAQLTYVGTRIASLGYQLVVIDSNSYGESLVRHRVTLSGTTEIAAKVFLTGIATLQIDQYPDGILIATDLQRTEFSNLEDENRSSLQVRLGRRLSDAWSIEMRGALWRDLGGGSTAMPTEFHRELLYGGVMYQH
jgi:hypothetical protein